MVSSTRRGKYIIRRLGNKTACLLYVEASSSFVFDVPSCCVPVLEFYICEAFLLNTSKRKDAYMDYMDYMDWCCVQEVIAWRGASWNIRRGEFPTEAEYSAHDFFARFPQGGGGATGKQHRLRLPCLYFTGYHTVVVHSNAYCLLSDSSALQRGTTAQRRNIELLLFRWVDRFLVPGTIYARWYATESCSTHENEHALHCHNQC